MNKNPNRLPWLQNNINSKYNSSGPIEQEKSTKNLNIFARFNNWFPHFLYFCMIAWAYFVLAAYAIIMMLMLNHIGLAIFYIIVIACAYNLLLKRYVRRWLYLRRLRAKCKKNKFRYKQERGLISSFKYAKRGADFRVDAGNTVYFVRFLSVRHKRSSLLLWDKDTAQIVYPRQRSWVNIRYDQPCSKIEKTHVTQGLGIMRITQMNICFDESFSVIGERNVKKVILLDPEPRVIYKKAKEGGVSVTGTGEIFGDYTIITPKDFLANVLGRK